MIQKAIKVTTTDGIMEGMGCAPCENTCIG